VCVGVRVCVSKLNTGCSTINCFYDIARSSRENRRERECAHWLANVGGLYYYYYYYYSSIITVRKATRPANNAPQPLNDCYVNISYSLCRKKKFDDSTIYTYIVKYYMSLVLQSDWNYIRPVRKYFLRNIYGYKSEQNN